MEEPINVVQNRPSYPVWRDYTCQRRDKTHAQHLDTVSSCGSCGRVACPLRTRLAAQSWTPVHAGSAAEQGAQRRTTATTWRTLMSTQHWRSAYIRLWFPTQTKLLSSVGCQCEASAGVLPRVATRPVPSSHTGRDLFRITVNVP